MAASTTRAHAFDYFDHAYVINRSADADRLQRTTKRLSRFGIGFERFVASEAPAASSPSIPGPFKPGNYACGLSHRRLLQQAIESDQSCILVLEDDVVFRDDVAEKLQHLIPQINSVPWDMFYLGLHLLKKGERLTENLAVVKAGFHTHAYAVTRRGMPLMIECINRSFAHASHFDGFEHPQLLKIYADPILAIQEPSRSAIHGCIVDRLGQYFPPFDRREFFEHCAEARSWETMPKAPTDAMLQKAKALQRSGKWNQAEAIYRQVLEAEPSNFQALHFLGLIQLHQGHAQAAIDLMQRAIAQAPDYPELHNNLGMALARAGRPAEALGLLERALQLKPDYPEALNNLGSALMALGRTTDALAALERAIELRPQSAESHNFLGQALLRDGRAQQALEHLRQAITLNPKFHEAYNNLGCALRHAGDLEGAVAAFRKSAQLCPPAPEAHSNLGTALSDMGRPSEAIAPLETAIELRPDYADAHGNLSLALLALGQFDRGWLEYEWRRHAQPDKFNRTFPQPPWNGCCLEGRTILLITEQGLGDTLQFVRYAPLLAQQGAQVIVECQPPLREILRGVKGIAEIIGGGEPLPPFDTHARLLSLPGIFRTRLGNVPADVPYLQADPHREAEWKRRLSGSGFKIGISWQGSKSFPNDRTRSIPLAAFEPLAAIPDVRLISLQKHAGAEQIQQIADRFKVEILDPPLDETGGAFVDTAAVMKQLDLVITSDTAIPHLAGALGVKVWMALCVGSEWRWLRDREDSPWYPTMRLFRQRTTGDWDEVFARIAAALRDTLSSAPPEEAPPVLTPVAPGEMLDRLTILQIKCDRLSDPSKLRTIRAELEALLRVRDSSLPHSEQLDQLVRELRTVNEALWQIEDDIRAADARNDFGPAFVELARSVYRTNDRRAELKRRINTLLGSALRDEKQYRAYGSQP